MKLFKKGEFKLLWPFYMESLITPLLAFAAAFEILFFNDLGFSFTQIGLIMMMFPLSTLIFELPTGAIADLYGRKASVLIGTLIMGIAMFSVFFLTNFYLILLAFAIMGFGLTFISGAENAWVVDLIKRNKKNYIQEYFSKKQVFNGVGVFLSGFIGAFFVKLFGVSIIWVAGGLANFVAFSILIFGQEHFIRRKIKIRKSFENINIQTKKSVNYSWKHPVLFSILLAGIIFVFAGEFGGTISWIPFLEDLGFPDYAFGYLWSALGLIGAIAPIVSLKLAKKNKERNFIVLSLIAATIPLFFIVFVSEIVFALGIVFIGAFFFALSQPVEVMYFHKFVVSKLRATVGSFMALVMSIAGIIALPLAGFVVDLIGPRYTIFLSALIMIPGIIIYSRIRE